MHALFEESGKFLAGRILSEADTSAQVELDSGKRVKVKSANILLKFDKPAPAELIAQAQAQAAQIDLDLAWEFAPEEEFGFADLARDYFSDKATLAEQAGALFRLYDAPHYFRRSGKGRFKKAPAEILQQALAGIEKKKQIQAQITAWAEQLGAGECPGPIREQLYKILFRPDKNAAEYKAVVEASRATRLAPLDLLHRAGAIESAYEFHWKRFLFDHFPKGTQFPALQAPQPPADLPLAEVQAFSIDDSATTEIDDALSVRGLGTGTVTVGIHIAAPGLAIVPGTPLDQLGRSRLSTVYMPGYKITMLPDEVVQIYTLDEGRANPAVSLYVTVDEATLETTASETRLERVPVQVNFRLVGNGGAEPRGNEQVEISVRKRGAPLDLIVAEAAIVANSTWGGWMAELGVPGIYRSQASLAPGIKVRMSTKAQPHAGIGVKSYAWATSPLRRYVDLVNQWQIIACARHGKTAALAAPFKPKDAELFGIISSFDGAYSAYNGYQAGMERFWTLKYLQQHAITELTATVIKEGMGGGLLVRADDLPLVFPVLGVTGLPRGAHVRVRLGEIDEIALDVSGTLIERLDSDAAAADDGAEDDEEAVAGPIAIAVDMNETDGTPAADPAQP